MSLTSVIAIVTIYIAWKQWSLEKNKFKLEMYDRRLNIYKHVNLFLDTIRAESNIKRNSIDKNTYSLYDFAKNIVESDFLFENDIKSFLKQLQKHGNQLCTLKQMYCDRTQCPPPNYDHIKIVNDMEIELNWFWEQEKQAKILFNKYLSLS